MKLELAHSADEQQSSQEKSDLSQLSHGQDGFLNDHEENTVRPNVISIARWSAARSESISRHSRAISALETRSLLVLENFRCKAAFPDVNLSRSGDEKWEAFLDRRKSLESDSLKMHRYIELGTGRLYHK